MTKRFFRLSLTHRILLGLFLGAVMGSTINLLSPPVEPAFEQIEDVLVLEGAVKLTLPAQDVAAVDGSLEANGHVDIEVPGATLRQTRAVDRSEPQPHAWLHVVLTHGLFEIVGQIFLAGLMVIVVPLVFVSLVCGVAALDDIRQLGRLGIKTVGLYLITTALAISMAVAAGVLIQPGAGFGGVTDEAYVAPEAPSLVQVIVDVFPRNPIDSMARGNMLQIIVFAILFGVALSLAGAAGKRLLDRFEDLNTTIMKLVWIIMEIAPFGVFALIAQTFASQGFSALAPLLKYFCLVLAVLIFQGIVVYPLLLKSLSGLNPITFMKKMRQVQAFAFSTASSNATIPVTLKTAEYKLGIRRSVASFSIPLGATINMDGTAIMQGVATVFIAQAYQIPLDIQQYLMIILTATLASIGTAGVPGVGLVMLAMVLNQVGLPVAGIALVLGVDRLLDMVRTVINVTGDAAVSCIVAKTEGDLDQAVYNSPLDLDSSPSDSETSA